MYWEDYRMMVSLDLMAQIYGENEYIRADTDAGKVGIKDYERYDGKVKDRKEVYHGIRE